MNRKDLKGPKFFMCHICSLYSTLMVKYIHHFFIFFTMIIHVYFQFIIIVLLVILYYIAKNEQVATTTNNNIMLSIRYFFNTVRSTNVVDLCNVDKDVSNISLVITNNNQYTIF